MELRSNVKRIGNSEIGLTVNEPDKAIIYRPAKVIDIPIPLTKAEKAKGILNDLVRGFQSFADYAATTKAGSQDMDDVFGLPKMSGNDDVMGIPNTPQRYNKKRRK